ncbi:MAG: glycosyltransferase family 2 protein [Bacteroidales bacterium]|jgi:glycosyltransferase involved in cell wall biosynthesis|nr:glycosyltransferase family 2 protein [Bacteroidales bacterium]
MVSVCLITYNGEKYISEQLQSIIDQLSDNDEIIVSDDGSSDSTLTIIQAFNDKRIKIVPHEPFRNPTFNMEFALQHAQGEYIFMSDQDDVWLPNKVSVMVDALQKADYVISDCYVTDENLNIIYNTRYVPELKIHKNKFMALFFTTPYQGSCVAFRRKILEKALPFPKYIQSHDRWVGNIAAFFYNVKFIPDKLIYYRRHGSNTSQFKSPNSIFKRIYYRLGYCWGLITRIFK